MRKRSLLEKVFGGFGQWRKNFQAFQLMNGYSPHFTRWSGDLYEAAAVREAVDAIARNAAKLKPRHIRRQGKDIFPPQDRSIERVLAVRPNEFMNSYDLLYKLITATLIDNNAFAFAQWSGSSLVNIFPVVCSQAEYIQDDAKQLFVRFTFTNGQKVILPYNEVIHLRRHFFKDDMSGSNNTPIDGTLEAIHVTNQGIGEAVRSSAYLRGLIKYQGILDPDDIEANRAKFVSQFMSVTNNGGIAALDSKAEFVPLDIKPKMVDAEQMRELRSNVYRYYGISENIVMSKYSEQEYDSFYESIIEPLALQLSLEFTNKLFTAREQGHGNEILFESNRLQYSSTRTKISLIRNLSPLGLFTINEAREIFNLSPVEGGDKRIQTLNVVNADKADEYQIGEGDGPNE